MKFYIETPLFFATIVTFLAGLGTKNPTYFAYGAVFWILLWLVGTEKAEQFGYFLVKKSGIERQRKHRSPVLADFFNVLTVTMIIIQIDIMWKILSVEPGRADVNLAKLFVVLGFFISFLFTQTFLIAKHFGISPHSVQVSGVAMRFQMMFLVLMAFTVSFFTESRNPIVYACLASTMLTSVAFGLWRVFPPKSEEQAS